MDEAKDEQSAGEHALTLVDKARDLRITDDASYTAAVQLLGAIREGIRMVRAYWEEPVKRARSAWMSLTERRDQMLDPLIVTESSTKHAVLAYKMEAEQRARAAEQAARAALEREARATQAALAEELREFGHADKAAEIASLPVSVPPVVMQSTPPVDGLSYREAWTFEVTDAAAVPREYLTIDDKKLAALARAMKADARVTGVRFYPEKVVVVKR
jgi:hypothetical protein